MMGPPDRFQFLYQPDYWVLPGAFLIGLHPGHLNFIAVKIGPFGVCLNWGPYMRVAEAEG